MRRWLGGLLSLVLVTTPLTPFASAAPTPTAKDKKECLAATNQGQDLRGEGKLRAAREQFLSCARDVCPTALKSECTKWVAELDADIPSIVIRVTRDGDDVTTAKVTIDDAPTALDGKPVLLDPGPHTLVAQVDGEKPIEDTVVLGTGEKNRVVMLALPTAKVTTAEPTKPPPDVAPPRPSEHGGPPAWAWIAGGVGLVGMGAFAFFAATGVKDVNRLDRECAPRCSDSDVDAAKRKLLFADIGLGVGLVGLGLATYGFLSAPSSTPRDEPTTTASIGVLPGGGAYAGLSGAF